MRKILISLLMSLMLIAGGSEQVQTVENEISYWGMPGICTMELSGERMILRGEGNAVLLDTACAWGRAADGMEQLTLESDELAGSDGAVRVAVYRGKDDRIVLCESDGESEWTYPLNRALDGRSGSYFDWTEESVCQELEGTWRDTLSADVGLMIAEERMTFSNAKSGALDSGNFRVVNDPTGDPAALYLVSPEDDRLSFCDISSLLWKDGQLTGTMDDGKTPLCFERMSDSEALLPAPDVIEVRKPVIYLYPEEETTIDVRLSLSGELTCAYPAYGDGWHVLAKPDGTLEDAQGRAYGSLFWEAECAVECDFSSGFCVPGNETAAFLEDALGRLGLTDREAGEMISYWLPQMRGSAYNLVAFPTEAYEKAARLRIEPEPETTIRVFMAWKRLEEPLMLPAQTLEAPRRKGFTVVEWGGAEYR